MIQINHPMETWQALDGGAFPLLGPSHMLIDIFLEGGWRCQLCPGDSSNTAREILAGHSQQL